MHRKILSFSLLLIVALIPNNMGSNYAAPALKKNDTLVKSVKAGEKIYSEGVLPNGLPIQGVIASDIPIDGRMFSCINCHQKSGLGSVEGSVITWPITGKELFSARRRTGAWNKDKEALGPGAKERWSLPEQFQAADARPAYTEETLATLLREGIDPTGREISRAMPRYQISDTELNALTDYLNTLSVTYDPGVTKEKIRFATVISDKVSATDKNAMLSVLQSHVDTHNTQTRPHLRRAKSGPFYKTEKYGAYRLFELDVWQLSGAESTWPTQLEEYYSAAPVFAMLGGIVQSDWKPIHAFCESNRIPCLFPVTNEPSISESDWYTLYFSKGYYQEGETVARYLRKTHKADEKILQIYRTTNQGKLLAKGFSEIFPNSSLSQIKNWSIKADEAIDPNKLKLLLQEYNISEVVLWLNAEDLKTISKALSSLTTDQQKLFSSWTLLDSNISNIPNTLKNRIYLSYPRALPQDNKRKLQVLKRWLKIRDIPATNLDIQSQMYALGWLLPGAISEMRSEFYRDYFLESFDMMKDQDYAIPSFPRLTFGPGQRYAAKGSYIVKLSHENDLTNLEKVSDWISH